MVAPTKNIVILLLVVIILALGFYWVYSIADNRISELGRKVCLANNMTFDHAGGEYAYCYITNQETGIKKSYNFWMDVGVCEQIYGNKTGGAS